MKKYIVLIDLIKIIVILFLVFGGIGAIIYAAYLFDYRLFIAVCGYFALKLGFIITDYFNCKFK